MRPLRVGTLRINGEELAIHDIDKFHVLPNGRWLKILFIPERKKDGEQTKRQA